MLRYRKWLGTVDNKLPAFDILLDSINVYYALNDRFLQAIYLIM